jgi:hypothetical protein
MAAPRLIYDRPLEKGIDPASHEPGDRGAMHIFAGVLLLSLLIAGCTSGGLSQASSPTSGAQNSSAWTDQVASFFATGGSRRPQQQAGEPPPPDDIDCPSVTVREGASTLAIHAAGEPSAMSLRYQGTIGRIARECKVVARTLQMKVGVEGRIVVGPAGGPGKLDVPLRLAVVREGPKPVTILTKTYRVPVEIGEGTGNIPFVQIDDALSFPLPPIAELDAYVVYVGYDAEALKKPEPRRRRGPPRAATR